MDCIKRQRVVDFIRSKGFNLENYPMGSKDRSYALGYNECLREMLAVADPEQFESVNLAMDIIIEIDLQK